MTPSWVLRCGLGGRGIEALEAGFLPCRPSPGMSRLPPRWGLVADSGCGLNIPKFRPKNLAVRTWHKPAIRVPPIGTDWSGLVWKPSCHGNALPEVRPVPPVPWWPTCPRPPTAQRGDGALIREPSSPPGLPQSSWRPRCSHTCLRVEGGGRARVASSRSKGSSGVGGGPGCPVPSTCSVIEM